MLPLLWAWPWMLFRLVSCPFVFETGVVAHPGTARWSLSTAFLLPWGQNQGQGMMEFHQVWNKSKKAQVDVAQQIASAAAGNPPCLAWLDELRAYAVSTDGDGQLLSELAHCQKSLAPLGASGLRLIGGEMLERINAQTDYPYFKNAILKANLTGSACKDSMCLAACCCSCMLYLPDNVLLQLCLRNCIFIRQRAVAVVFGMKVWKYRLCVSLFSSWAYLLLSDQPCVSSKGNRSPCSPCVACVQQQHKAALCATATQSTHPSPTPAPHRTDRPYPRNKRLQCRA